MYLFIPVTLRLGTCMALSFMNLVYVLLWLSFSERYL